MASQSTPRPRPLVVPVPRIRFIVGFFELYFQPSGKTGMVHRSSGPLWLSVLTLPLFAGSSLCRPGYLRLVDDFGVMNAEFDNRV